eukprot:3926448-Alexandrium_andersonii.AAC.1
MGNASGGSSKLTAPTPALGVPGGRAREVGGVRADPEAAPGSAPCPGQGSRHPRLRSSEALERCVPAQCALG